MVEAVGQRRRHLRSFRDRRDGCERETVTAGCRLEGDSGYPSKKWLLTLYLRPLPGPQSNYNSFTTMLRLAFLR
ncbi:hypothetical protein E2C01_033745 [Portunus trituberculatus]|uniref:DDE Tnp4 domain-containing protein n=1 Tax=Portunus trituberculatus TaxID=210409 RepID=A0A5B7F4K5_PORTR|nr:hypothetical protein [Portunus trituberculatus]